MKSKAKKIITVAVCVTVLMCAIILCVLIINRPEDTLAPDTTPSETIPCKHVTVVDPAVPPTCIQTGLSDGKHCDACGMVLLEQTSIPTVEHNYVDGVCTMCGTPQPISLEDIFVFTELEDGTYSVRAKDVNKMPENLVIPEKYKEKAVTVVEEDAFKYCQSVISVTIPNSVTSIGNFAFYMSPNLARVNIPDGVVDISSYAFAQCSSLASVNIPDGVVDISNYAFADCTSLQSITIPDSVTSIGNKAFYGCTGLESLSIGSSVRSINRDAFSECTGLAEFYFNAAACSVESSFVRAGKSADGIKLTIGSSVRYVPSGFLSVRSTIDTANLISVDFESGSKCETIGASSFSYCYRLKSVILPDGLKTIGDRAFYSCSGLESMAIPDSVTSVGKNAFDECPDGIFNIYDNSRYLGKGQNKYWCLYSAQNKKITSVSVHEATKIIADYAFKECKALSSVYIPNGVLSIGIYAFEACESLKSVVIPDSVQSIDSAAFYDCIGLKSLTIGKGVTYIGIYAFDDCVKVSEIYYNAIECEDMPPNFDTFGNLGKETEQGVKVIIGPDVRRIPAHIFYSPYQSDIPKITSLEFDKGSKCESIGGSAFNGCRGLRKVSLPSSVTSIGGAFINCDNLEYNIYDNAKYLGNEQNKYMIMYSVTSDYITSIKIHSSTKVISANFNLTEKLKSAYISDLETWCNIKFETEHCNPLYYGADLCIGDQIITEFVVPDGITRLGDYVFAGCDSLVSIKINDKVTNISSNAFYGCVNVQSIIVDKNNKDYFSEGDCIVQYSNKELILGCKNSIIPNDVEIIGENAFRGCESLTAITIPGSVTSIEPYAFCMCKGITEIAISDSVISIGDYAFYGCKSLTSITIPNGVTVIGEWAFAQCDKLADITIGNGVTSIGMYSFYYCASLTSVTLPSSLCNVERNLFYGCKKLESVTMPVSIINVGDDAFQACDSFRYVYYSGTEDQWKQIIIGEDNNRLYNATIYYNHES